MQLPHSHGDSGEYVSHCVKVFNASWTCQTFYFEGTSLSFLFYSGFYVILLQHPPSAEHCTCICLLIIYDYTFQQLLKQRKCLPTLTLSTCSVHISLYTHHFPEEIVLSLYFRKCILHVWPSVPLSQTCRLHTVFMRNKEVEHVQIAMLSYHVVVFYRNINVLRFKFGRHRCSCSTKVLLASVDSIQWIQ